MGLFDEIYCEYELPGEVPEFIKKCPSFQTKDLGEGMGQYIITKEGELFLDLSCYNIPGIPEFFLTNKKIGYSRKKIEMYGSNIRAAGPRDGKYVWYTDDGSDYISITYIVQIRKGKVTSIKETHRTVEPAEKYVK